MSKIQWVKSEKGIAITLESFKGIVKDVCEKHWEGSAPEVSTTNYYARGRAKMRDELLEKIEEVESKLNGISNDSDR